MSTIYRCVHTGFWNHPKVVPLSVEEKLVLLHLITNEFTNPMGIYKASLGGLADDARMEREAYDKAFRKVIDSLLIEYDEDYHVVWVKDFLEWNKPGNPKGGDRLSKAYR